MDLCGTPLERKMGETPLQKGDDQNDLTFDGFKGAIPLFTRKKDGFGKSGYLGGTFGCFWALRGGPWSDGWAMHHLGW